MGEKVELRGDWIGEPKWILILGGACGGIVVALRIVEFHLVGLGTLVGGIVLALVLATGGYLWFAFNLSARRVAITPTSLIFYVGLQRVMVDPRDLILPPKRSFLGTQFRYRLKGAQGGRGGIMAPNEMATRLLAQLKNSNIYDPPS
jgi:hypothetical protein